MTMPHWISAYSGELAALLTTLCWSFNSIVFSLAGRRVGSGTVNHMRLWMALVALLGVHWLLFGTPFPWQAESQRLVLLGVSGMIGFVVGDALLFEAFVRIGPRLSMLLMTSVPICGAFLGWLVLGERLRFWDSLAITVTVVGIGWVVSENRRSANAPIAHLGSGLLLAAGAAMGQAGGMLLSKMGLAGNFSPISGTLIRITAATLTMTIYHLVRGSLRADFARMRDTVAFRQILSGALTGPVLGVSLSLYAVAHTPIGIATTLMSLAPVVLLPVSHFYFKERVSWRAVIGTVVALSGAALFFVR